MQVEINGNKDDLSAMLLSAERYALGRQTYIVNWTCEFIDRNTHLLTEKDKQVMISDIRTANNYGMEMDKQNWLKLLEILEKE